MNILVRIHKEKSNKGKIGADKPFEQYQMSFFKC